MKTKKQKEKALKQKIKLLKYKDFAFYNYEVLSTKLKTSDKLKFLKLCKKKEVKPSTYLREMVLRELKGGLKK